MMSKTTILLLLLLACVACNKDKYQTKPSLKIKKLNTSDVFPNQTLVVTLEYTDKEGDLGGGKIGVEKKVANCALSDFIDTLKYSISNSLPATKNQIAEVDIQFSYFFINPRCNFNDTAIFKFWVTDKAGHQSDTVTTSTIIIRKS